MRTILYAQYLINTNFVKSNAMTPGFISFGTGDVTEQALLQLPNRL